jgi:hypothetical protein
MPLLKKAIAKPKIGRADNYKKGLWLFDIGGDGNERNSIPNARRHPKIH